MPSGKELREDIRQFVRQGGIDAFEFSLSIYPHYADLSGDELQRIIDAEVAKGEAE